jgi:hypothetical protein
MKEKILVAKIDIIIVPLKQSGWSKKWEAFKEKVNLPLLPTLLKKS